MKWTNSFIPTVKEDPTEAESISHKLMLRSGLIRKLSAGTYSYLPLGFRVLNKVINIVREEMDRAGSLEMLLPALHPPELWEKTGRLKDFGDIIFKITDRSGKLNLLGPTHEEVITALVSNEISSYRQLPVILYQIQTKFRDEIRPRFGVVRSKEFLMMDAYSFDADDSGLDKSYQKMYDAYCRIFDRCKLPYKIIEADPGLMGGKGSYEFTCPSPAGEDNFVNCSNCNYSAYPNLAPIKHNDSATAGVKKDMNPVKEVATPNKSSVEAVSNFLSVQPSQLVKTMICNTAKGPVAVLVRGDHELSLNKLSKLLSSAQVELADEKTIEKVTGGHLGFSGPVGLKNITIIADYSILGMADFITGANKNDTHLLNVNINRDFKIDRSADIRVITENDNCPSCGKKQLKMMSGIELGHIFKLGTKYSESLNACFLDEKGNRLPIIMGCYGIGVNRIIAASIENSYDQNGIIWPRTITPYSVLIVSVNPSDDKISQASKMIYDGLSKQSIEMLWDERDVSAGIKFKDADLIGIPLIITVGRELKNNKVDIKYRANGAKETIPLDEVVEHVVKYQSIQ
ncbi:MAG: proline--tRNA ligase [Planctomycetota bacterium]